MKKILKNSLYASVAVVAFSGCGDLFTVGDAGNSGATAGAGGLIPPSASNQPAFAPIAAPTYPPMPGYNTNPNLIAKQNNPSAPQKINTLVVEKIEVPGLTKENLEPRFDKAVDNNEPRADNSGIANSPMLTPENEITLSAVGIGVSPENSLSPSQAFAMAKRAAIVDAYRQIGEKMYGIRVNAQDTVRDMMLQSSTVKTKVQALIRNAEILETVYKDGLCQVNMELKLDGRIWHRILSNTRAS